MSKEIQKDNAEFRAIYHRLTCLETAVNSLIKAFNGQVVAVKIGAEPFTPGMAKLPELEK